MIIDFDPDDYPDGSIKIFKITGGGRDGKRNRPPGVAAIIDGKWITRWSPSGWRCTCEQTQPCEHAEDLGELIDPKIFRPRKEPTP